MAKASNLMTATPIDTKNQAIRDMCYGLAFHMKCAEKAAIACPDELGRKLWHDIANEHRNLVLMLYATLDGLAESMNAMKAFYAEKADQCFSISTESRIGKEHESQMRENLGDLRYVLRYMESYIASSISTVADLTSRQDLDNASKIFGQIGNVFRRIDAGDTDYVSWTMAEWKVQCSVHLDNPTIDL